MNRTRSIREPEAAAYLFTTALALLPVWSVSVFPSQDGGAHLYNAHVLSSFLSGEPAAHFADIYALNVTGLANWVDHLLLAGLMTVVLPATAEKLLVSAYIVAFAAAARYAAEAVRPGNAWTAHLALPLTFTFNVHMGFYNFVLSLPLYLILLGYYWRHHDGHYRRALAVAAVLLMAMYVLHPLAWLFGVLSLAVVVIAGARSPDTHGRPPPRRTARRVLDVAGAALPGAILLLVLVGNEPVETTEWQPVPALLRHIYSGGPLWTFGPVDSAFGGALFAHFAVVSVIAWRSSRHGDAHGVLASLTCAYLALVVVLPWQWKSLGLITERVGTFAFLTWVLALAGCTYRPGGRIVAIVAAQTIALALVARWTTAVQAFEPFIAEYLSVAPHLEPNRRLVELNFATRGRAADGQRLSHPVAPFAHTIGHVGIERNAVILNDYEALTAVFPLRHRSDAAVEALESTTHEPPDFRTADFEQVERVTCRPIDYVVLWQADHRDPGTQALLQQLADRYVLTFTSRPAGHAQVLTRRGDLPCG